MNNNNMFPMNGKTLIDSFGTLSTSTWTLPYPVIMPSPFDIYNDDGALQPGDANIRNESELGQSPAPPAPALAVEEWMAVARLDDFSSEGNSTALPLPTPPPSSSTLVPIPVVSGAVVGRKRSREDVADDDADLEGYFAPFQDEEDGWDCECCIVKKDAKMFDSRNHQGEPFRTTIKVDSKKTLNDIIACNECVECRPVVRRNQYNNDTVVGSMRREGGKLVPRRPNYAGDDVYLQKAADRWCAHADVCDAIYREHPTSVASRADPIREAREALIEDLKNIVREQEEATGGAGKKGRGLLLPVFDSNLARQVSYLKYDPSRLMFVCANPRKKHQNLAKRKRK